MMFPGDFLTLGFCFFSCGKSCLNLPSSSQNSADEGQVGTMMGLQQLNAPAT